ncbi:MAG: phosphotransferase family protein [Dehalococcoidia bacterium]
MTAGWLDDVRGPPDAAGLARMAAALAPGSRAVGIRRLGGGLDAAMHRFDLLAPSGERQRLVLRRYPRAILEENPGVAGRCWRTLSALEQLGVAAPRPVWFDPDGTVFGTAAFVMTRVPGHSDLRPRDLTAWLRGLGAALAAVHRVRVDGVDLSFLRGPEESLERKFALALEPARCTGPHGAAVQAALTAWRPRLRRMVPVLCHGDYWAGNTLWLRGRLTAIVDWDDARLGYPGMDVGYCRMDLALQHDVAAADVFLRAYETAAGMRVPQLLVWDLLGAAPARPDPERWLPGFHDLGRTDLTPALVRDRLERFTEDALARAGG